MSEIKVAASAGVPRTSPPRSHAVQADDLSVDFELLVRHAHWLLGNGCDGLVLFGTTGEPPP